jgi:hypothetical protein
MPSGPQQFDIPISDQLFPTNNPKDPIIGIAPSALVPVTVPWNAQRTELEKDKDGKIKEVVFGKTKWSGAGTGPHDVFEEQIGGKRVKVGTISWSIETTVYQELQQRGNERRWRVTPCPILLRTYKPLDGPAETTEVAKNPQPCHGKWVTV